MIVTGTFKFITVVCFLNFSSANAKYVYVNYGTLRALDSDCDLATSPTTANTYAHSHKNTKFTRDACRGVPQVIWTLFGSSSVSIVTNRIKKLTKSVGHNGRTVCP